MACLFCDFSSKKRIHHLNGYPFMILHQTKQTHSFLAIDFVAHEDGHIIVTTKKHYKKIEDIPKPLCHELIDHVSLAVKITRKTHGGANVLLNDGPIAEQTIPHTHFHVIPRDKGDGIHIEPWRRSNMSQDKFVKISNKLKKKFSA